MPSEMVADSTYIVEVNIDKGDLYGFAKFQQNFPSGFDVKPVQTSEASFTFADGKVKFIWMALPEDEKVKIVYAVTASTDVSNTNTISGKFSYIQDNERKSYDMSDHVITIVEDEPVLAEKVPASAAVSRTVASLGDNKYRVDIAIEKSGIEGFSKIVDMLPEGAEAESIETKKAMFSQVDEKVKFVWMSIPEDEILKVSYEVTGTEDMTAELMAMEGNFSFLDDNNSKTVAIMGGSPEDVASMIAQTETDAQEEDEPEATEEAEVQEEVAEAVEEKTEVVEEVAETVEESVSEEVAAVEEVAEEVEETVEEVVEEVAEVVEEEVVEPVEEAVVASTSTPEPVVSSMVSPETGVTYKVQILAGHKLVEESFVRAKYAFKEDYGTENHEGWVKYTTGKYAVYREARDKRESLVDNNHNFPGPFVTAYNSGERITVQEALMISNQKWVQ